MAIQVQIRRDTAANWTSNDPTLAQGEWGYETDTGKLKIGNGSTAWTSLGYFEGDHANLSNLDYASAGHTGFEPSLPLTTRGDILYRNSSNVTDRLAAGTNTQVLTSDGTDISWEDPSGGGASRETIISSGGSSDVNTAITAMNAAGGGIVRLDCLLDMDGDITMKENVLLMGYGKGTGLRNNTANAYKIIFAGSAHTYYGISCTLGQTQLTTDTASDASNFSQGDYLIIKDDTSTHRLVQLAKIRDDGNPSTGVVLLYNQIDDGYNAASVAAPMAGAVKNSGIMLMDIVNTSSGSLEIEILRAHDIQLENLYIEECFVTIEESGRIAISNCKFTVLDTTSHTRYIEIGEWVDDTRIVGCIFTSATYGIHMLSNKAWARALIANCYFECQTGIYIQVASPYNGNFYKATIDSCTFSKGSAPDGSRQGYGISGYGYSIYCVINSCNFTSMGNSAITWLGGGTFVIQWTISNCLCYGTFSMYTLNRCRFSNNYFYGNFTLSYGPSTNMIVGNHFDSSVNLNDNNLYPVLDNTFVGNVVDYALYLYGDSSRVALRNIIVGNKMGIFSLLDHGNDNVISSNMINGNVTITDSSGDVADRNIFSNNNVNGAVTWTEANQDYNVQIGNTTNGTITDLTSGGGTGNIQANNTEY